VLIYAVVRFRIIIGKYGLLKRVNYRRFIINAGGMGLYALSVLVYVGVTYYLLETYYKLERTPEADIAREKAIYISLRVYLGCNIISFCA
jgi:hypothetical protein